MRLPRPIDAATQARVSTEGRRCLNPPCLQSPSVMSTRLFVRSPRRCEFSSPREAVTRLLDGRHHPPLTTDVDLDARRQSIQAQANANRNAGRLPSLSRRSPPRRHSASDRPGREGCPASSGRSGAPLRSGAQGSTCGTTSAPRRSLPIAPQAVRPTERSNPDHDGLICGGSRLHDASSASSGSRVVTVMFGQHRVAPNEATDRRQRQRWPVVNDEWESDFIRCLHQSCLRSS
jgi:hypothetical protein